MKKKNKNLKLIRLYILLSICFGLGSIGVGVASIFFKEYNFILYMLIATVSGVFLSLLFLIFAFIRYKKDITEKEFLSSSLSLSIDAYKQGEKRIIIPNSSSTGLNLLASNINTLGFAPIHLEAGNKYSREDFIALFDADIRSRRFSSCYLVRLVGADIIDLRKMEERWGNFIVVKDEAEFYIVLFDIDELSLDIYLSRFIKYNKKLFIAYAIYPFGKIEDAFPSLAALPIEPGRLFKVEPIEHKASFEEFLEKASTINISDDFALTDFLKESLFYLDLTHLGIKLNDNYIRQVTYEDLPMLNEVKEEDFLYFKEEEILRKEGNRVYLVMGNTEKYRVIDKEEIDKMIIFKTTLLSILNRYLDSSDARERERRIEELCELTSSFNYTITSSFEISYISDSWKNKLPVNPIGMKCYKALYGLDKPCEDCPITKANLLKTNAYLGSGRYHARARVNGKNKDIFMLEEKKNYLSPRSALDEDLVDLINADEKGYVLVIKIERIEDLATRNKITVSAILGAIYERMSAYNLGYNLYIKDIDELAFILKDISRVEAIDIAKKVTFCLNDKLDFGKNGLTLPYRIILLSYPLEVSSIFSLDSLSRTMFDLADKKGRLYMVDETPLPIDKRRYYVETLEASFIKDNIPLKFLHTLDRMTKLVYNEIHLDFFDYEGRPIKEDEMTLYAKQDGLYNTMIERLIRQLDFEDKQYILPLAKESLNQTSLDSIARILASRKVDKRKLVLLIRERDYVYNKQAVKNAIEAGLIFALDNILNYVKEEFDFKPLFARISYTKYNKNQEYASRVISIKARDIDLDMDEVNESFDNRFVTGE